MEATNGTAEASVTIGCRIMKIPALDADTNARLLANAPVMLEVLKAVVQNWMESTSKQQAIAQKAIDCSLVLYQARMVLEKVNGEAAGVPESRRCRTGGKL